MPRVLVVDDQAPLREVLSMALETDGIEVVPAAGGEAALTELCRATAEADGYDAMVLDICMPDIDGWQVLEAVKSNPLWKDMTVIVVSGYANGAEEIARVCRYDGVYVEKNGSFLHVVRATLNRLVHAAEAS